MKPEGPINYGEKLSEKVRELSRLMVHEYYTKEEALNLVYEINQLSFQLESSLEFYGGSSPSVIEVDELRYEIEHLRSLGKTSICTIQIVHNNDGTSSLSIWDKIKNEQCEDLEEGRSHIENPWDAVGMIHEVVHENPSIIFLRLPDSHYKF